MAKIAKDRRNYFVTVDQGVAQDSNLSWKARGLFLYLWSQDDSWNFYQSEVVNHAPDGMDSLRSGLEELENKGYLTRNQKRQGGKFSNSDWILHEKPVKTGVQDVKDNKKSNDQKQEKPLSEKPLSENPISGNPISEKPISGNPTLINNNNNKDQHNKEQYNNNEQTQGSSSLKSDFEKLWSLYPRKEGKKPAFAAYKRAIKKGTTNKDIQNGIINYKKQIKIQGTTKNYIKQGSTWFNQECWNDEPNFTPPPKKRNGRDVVQKEALPDWAKSNYQNDQPKKDDKSKAELNASIQRRLAEIKES